MLDKIGVVAHLMALLSIGVVMLYLLQGGEEDNIIASIFGGSDNAENVFYFCAAFLVLEIPFSIYLHYRESSKINESK